MTVSVQLVYLARLRDAFGMASEQLTLAEGVTTVSALIAELRSRRGVWATELDAGRAWRVAVNHVLRDGETLLAEGDEVAILPPVTGG